MQRNCLHQLCDDYSSYLIYTYLCSFIFERIVSQINLSYTPHLSFVFSFIGAQSETSLSTFGFSPLSCLSAKSQSNTLEVVLDASLRARLQFGARPGHILLEDRSFLLHDGENTQERGFCGELDWDDQISDARKNRGGQERQVWANDVVVFAADGTDNNKSQTASVDWRAWWNGAGKGFDNGLDGVEALVAGLREEVLTSC